MKPVPFIQKLLLLAFLLMLAVPSANLAVNRLRYGRWGVDPRLSGVTDKVELPPITMASWWNGSLQTQFNAWYGTYFGQKRRLVTGYNGFLYGVFRVSHMYQDQIAIGPRDWLFEKAYLEDYFDLRPPMTEKSLLERVDAIDELHRLCGPRGICFMVLISPGKASFHPDEAPEWFRNKGVRQDRDYPRLVQLLRERAIPTVDAVELLGGEKIRNGSLPLFTRGGTHWNHYAANFVLQAALKRVGDFHQKLPPGLSLSNIHVDRQPTGSDTDLADLLNLPRSPTDYPTVKFDYTIDHGPSAFRPKTVWAGSSFSWTLLDLAHTPEGRLFSSIDFAYYHGDFHRWDDAKPWDERTKYISNSDKQSALAALQQCDLIVLEMNEAGIAKFDYSIRFCRDAADSVRARPLKALQK